MTIRSAETEAKQPYSPPTIKVVGDDELLRTFQVTSAAGAWWVTAGGGSS